MPKESRRETSKNITQLLEDIDTLRKDIIPSTYKEAVKKNGRTRQMASLKEDCIDRIQELKVTINSLKRARNLYLLIFPSLSIKMYQDAKKTYDDINGFINDTVKNTDFNQAPAAPIGDAHHLVRRKKEGLSGEKITTKFDDKVTHFVISKKGVSKTATTTHAHNSKTAEAWRGKPKYDATPRKQ